MVEGLQWLVVILIFVIVILLTRTLVLEGEVKEARNKNLKFLEWQGRVMANNVLNVLQLKEVITKYNKLHNAVKCTWLTTFDFKEEAKWIKQHDLDFSEEFLEFNFMNLQEKVTKQEKKIRKKFKI